MRISDWSSDVCSSDLPIERISTAVFGDYQITDGIQIFGEFLYTHRKSDQLATPGTLRNISISAANPTNPTGQDLLLVRSEEHTSELQSLMRNSYAVFCLKKTK